MSHGHNNTEINLWAPGVNARIPNKDIGKAAWGTPQTFDAISAFSSLSRSQTGQSKKPASSLKSVGETGKTLLSQSKKLMGRLRFELRTNRLKAECSTAELATRAFWAPMERITLG